MIQSTTKQALPKIWEATNLDATKGGLPDLMKNLFVYPFGQPGQALEGLFNEAAQLMRMQGVAQENIKVGLIIFSVICSAKMGMPLAIVLRVDEDRAVADHLLSACLKLVPRTLFVELHGLKADDLFSAGDCYRNKVLVCRDLKSIKKIESELINLIVNGHISIQTTAKTKYGAQMVDLKVSGPVAFIGTETESEPHLFNNPRIIRITVSESDFNQDFDGRETRDISGAEFEMARIAKYVNSVMPRNVSFTLQDAFSSAIRKQHPVHFIYKNRFAVKLIGILTILNNPGTPDIEEFLAKAMDTKQEHVRSWMKKAGLRNWSKRSADEELIVGKVEYDIAAKLLKEILPAKYPILSPLRKQLFEVVKDINFAKVKASFTSPNSLLRQLYTLAHADTYWAKVKDVYLNYNNNRADIISEIRIEKELVALKKIGVIERKKFKNIEGHGYYVTTVTVDKGIEFPRVTELFGECDNNAKKEVMDPVNGNIEQI